jgi:diguanylate cyclase (GGDEF)-like protein/PAS domain S-box-containing protein
MTRSDYTHPEDVGRDAQLYRQLLAGERDSFRMEKRYVHKDGSVMWGRLSVSRIEGAEDEPAFAVGVVEDITEIRDAAQEIERLNRQNRLILDSAGEGIYGLDTEGKTTFVNPAAAAMTGFDPEDLIGKSLHEVVHHSYSDRTSYPVQDCPIHAALTDGEVHRVDDEVFWRKDGTSFQVEYTSTPILEDVEIVGAVVTFTDITERKTLEERLEYQALHDPLTGLPNRQLLLDRLGHALARTQRSSGSGVAVLFMDLDGFKVVNDSLGHDTGDRLLAAVAERLRRCLRPEDALARFGGDEFVVLVEDVDDSAEAVRVAERITEELRWPFRLKRRELYVAVSIGISLGDARTHDPEDLLRDADTAMYRAKEAGSDYSLFDPAMHERAVLRLALENDLKRAIERGEFVVHYQPIVGLDDRSVWGVEALVRWEHPERGLLNPDEFVPVAEESGLVVPMGTAVLEEACRRAKGWQEAYPKMPPLIVYVNLSARQLARPDLAEAVEGALRRTGFDGNCLGLDVTETVYVTALEGNTAALDRLRALGVRVSIDDFGTGYSSLSYLKRLPADALKIDKSFVRGLGEDVEDTTIVRMVVELAHTLGMEVIAEGVETEEQAALLAEMGCDKAQGYHFSRPLPPEDVPGFLGG